jgi:radical SAM superfamily enzyme YgiQ (UPF0313 family)
MKKLVYLVNPRSPENFWAMQGALDIVGKHKTLMPNAALLTLMALTPAELPIDYVYCDENLTPIDWDLDCDLVALTGYTLQAERMRQIGREFRARGVPIAVGGIYATIHTEAAAQIADYLFVGEAEYTWPEFLRDWQAERPRTRYQQTEFTDLRHVPPPDLSHIHAKDYLYFSVQTSRGCPNNCDFCDVVGVAGRKRRSKTVPQILQEVRNAHAAGAETVFFSDDNFFVNRAFTVQLLRELVAWNRTVDRPLSFSTQATLLIGSDEEVLRLLADARFRVIFVGLETLKKECLEEVNKGQLARHDPYQIVPRLSSYGIVPFLGMMVGFDHDSPAVFREIEDFLQATGSPIASISVLNAPENTALFRRMQSQGRLVEGFRGFWHDTTNIVPKQMTRQELHQGHRELFRRIYEPELFEQRMIRWLENVRYLTTFYSTRSKNFHRLFLILRVLRHFTFRVPAPMRAMFFRIVKAAWRINPRLVSQAVSILVQYWHYYDFTHKQAWNVRAWPERALAD